MQDLTGLGRLHVPDPRDRKHLMRAEPLLRTNKTWTSSGVLDQGSTSQCVAYSTVKYLETSPVINRWSKSGYQSITQLYKEAQNCDEWPGDDYDGTSVRAALKVMKARGYVSDYSWAFDVNPVISHVLNKGPVIVGTNWHMDMFTPDKFGYIYPTGDNVGGHAYLIIGANTKRINPDRTLGAVRLINSWGPGWAQNGRAWMKITDLQKLIKADGEAAVATEILRK